MALFDALRTAKRLLALRETTAVELLLLLWPCSGVLSDELRVVAE
jgi:hypothetical protein